MTVVEEHILTVVLEQTNSVQPETHTDVLDEVVNVFVPSEEQGFMFSFDEYEDVPKFHLGYEDDDSVVEVEVSPTPPPRSSEHDVRDAQLAPEPEQPYASMETPRR